MESESEFHTRFDRDGIGKGWVSITSKRAILDRFEHRFGSVDLTAKRFPGFEHYGHADVEWAGLPVAVLSLPKVQTEPYPDSMSDQLKGILARPRAKFILQREADLANTEWTQADLLDLIAKRIMEFEKMNEFDRRHGATILFTSHLGALCEFASRKVKGSR